MSTSKETRFLESQLACVAKLTSSGEVSLSQ